MRRGAWRAIACVVVALIASACGGEQAADDVVVPDLIGMEIEDAGQALCDRGLTAVIGKTRQSPTTASGARLPEPKGLARVHGQHPPDGASVAPGTAIRIYLRIAPGRMVAFQPNSLQCTPFE